MPRLVFFVLLSCSFSSLTAFAQLGTSSVEANEQAATQGGEAGFLHDFMHQVAAQVEWSRIVEMRSTNPDVKAFAKTVVDRNMEIAYLLLDRGKSYQPQYDKRVTGKDEETSDKLRALSSPELDRAYLKALQKVGHEAMDTLDAEDTQTQDAGLKVVSMKLAPIITKENDDAHKLEKKLR